MAVNTKDLAPLQFPKIHPEQAAREFLHSKAFDSVVKKCPEWDVARADPTGELVLQKRELHNAEARLAKKKEEAVRKREEVDALWRNLDQKENVLRSNFVKFNRFIKENQEKRERAERKRTEATVNANKTEVAIYNLDLEYKYMADIKSRMEKNIKSHWMYEDYLLRVTKSYPIFRTYDAILDRYEALAEARKVLSDRQEEDLSTLEEARANVIKMTESKTLEVMGLYNLIAELQIRYEVAKTKALHWETMVARINSELKARLEDLQNVRQACWALYLSMCSRKEVESSLSEENVEHQLLFIKSTMGELKGITKIAQRRANKELLAKSDSNKQK
ncbi:hypothetical protein PPYR_14546 [Photinus pyralis]|uniref:DUF4200 domain-containing protein n=2 Tax=Photinus pyralis TaxID=7054 RepID=A0A5N4A2Z8_PHOPY|nr:coiled-coil domain-containing protein 42 homolog [Photinus pyralis]XP_031357453.1 coiled-coil domain-containing protein 42 homolog [Photinus pyralis]KAB0791686.1 hypothetical protein PPYR_03486 [Photinus pyralis]KAB0792587.1 hypothetical protein PPYR_14546 [Photinus pyralis]